MKYFSILAPPFLFCYADLQLTMTLRRNDMKLIRKADILLFAALMVTAGLLFALPVFRVRASASAENALTVVIRQNGKPYGTYSLNKDREIHIKNGKQENVVSIENGSVLMKKSTCKNQVCVDEGKISRAGQSIICLPNRVVVEIQENKKTSESPESASDKNGNDQGVDAVVK